MARVFRFSRDHFDQNVQKPFLDSLDDWLKSNTSLSLEAQKMLINAWLERNKQFSSSSPSPTGSGNGGNVESCQQMSVTSANIPSGLAQIDPTTGALTWSIVPHRPDSNYVIRLRSIFVQTTSSNVGTVRVIPYILQNGGQAVPSNSFSGQVNAVINAIPGDYSADIVFFLVIMSPVSSGIPIDPNRITVVVDYCYIGQAQNTGSGLNNIPSYYLQNGFGNIYNQQPSMLSLT